MPCCICYRCFLSYDSSSSPVSHKTASIFYVPTNIALHLRRWSIRSCLFVFFTHVPDVTGVTDCVITLAQKMLSSTRCCKSSLVSLELMGMMSPFLVEGGKSFAQSPSCCCCWLLTFFSIPLHLFWDITCGIWWQQIFCILLLMTSYFQYSDSCFSTCWCHPCCEKTPSDCVLTTRKHWIVMCCGRLHQCCCNWSKKKQMISECSSWDCFFVLLLFVQFNRNTAAAVSVSLLL